MCRIGRIRRTGSWARSLFFSACNAFGLCFLHSVASSSRVDVIALLIFRGCRETSQCRDATQTAVSDIG